MVGMHHGRDAILEVTIGGSKDGAIQAYRLNIIQNVGAYAGIGAFLPHLTGLMASGVYAIPKIEVQANAVVTNTTPVGPFRGAGRPEATQAIERAVDLFAAEIGVDPAEVRRRNFISPDAFPFTDRLGRHLRLGDYEGALDLALAAAGYDGLREEQQRRRARRRRPPARDRPQHVRRDHERVPRGGVRRRRDHPRRRGDPAHGLVLARTGARDDVRDDRRRQARDSRSSRSAWSKGDTDEVARGTGTYGSKSTQIGGAAAALAAEEVAEQARRLAADYLEISAEDTVLDLGSGRFHGVGAPSQGLSWSELAARLEQDARLGELHIEHDFRPASPTFPFGAHVAVVEVDTETGAVELLRLVAVDDAGTLDQPGRRRRTGARRGRHRGRAGALRGGRL